jgi:hypothetical protein
MTTRQFFKGLFCNGSASAARSIGYHKSKIDLKEFERIKHRYFNADPDPGYSKYLDLDRHLAAAIDRCERAGVGTQTKLAILDVGTGAGYFPFVCQNLGHTAGALDVPNHTFYSEMIQLLGVVCHPHRIRAFEPLPRLGRKYDLVTAFAICFNNHARDDLWGPREWDFFLCDLRDNVLARDGRALLELNQEPNGEFASRDLITLLSSWHATVNKGELAIRF